ncbi:MAG: hypothetical protein ACRCX2_31880 [Paraclostridium sp.]
MEIIKNIAGLWNEFLIVGLFSGLIGAILAGIMAMLVDNLKLISSIVVAIPMSVCLAVAKVTMWIALILGVVQLVLNLL